MTWQSSFLALNNLNLDGTETTSTSTNSTDVGVTPNPIVSQGQNDTSTEEPLQWQTYRCWFELM